MMINKKKEYEKEVEALHAKVKSMQREIGTLTKKLLAKNTNGVASGVSSGGGGGSGSQDESAANSPASST